MSVLGYVSGQLEREQQQLDAINRAVLALQAESLGMGEALDVDRAAVAESRASLRAFLAQLTVTLAGGVTHTPLPAAAALLSGQRAREDWLEDLRAVLHALETGARLQPMHLSALTEIVRALDREFAGTVHRLYGRR